MPRSVAPVSDRLDFSAVKELAATLAQSPLGQEQVRGLLPFERREEAERELAAVGEMSAFLAEHGRLPLSGVTDPRPALSSLREAGGLAQAEEVRTAVAVCRASGRCREMAEPGKAPLVSALLAELPDLSALARRAGKLFEPDGTLSDSASPRLSELRGRLRQERGSLYEAARRWLSEHPAEAAGETVVLRDERYCVPVNPASAATHSSIVHGRSGSGATIFAEPMELAAGNNRLAMLRSDLAREEERIRREFGRELLGSEEEILAASRILFRLDALAARGELARLTEAVRPEFSDDGTWEIAGMRHPLLDERLARLRAAALEEARPSSSDVPLDVELAPSRRWLLISGPNAGGKTVVLKTMALASLLAQSGFFVPARRATLPFFSRILVHLSEEQSLLTHLSSFSASARRLSEILQEADAESLVLLDEPGGNTDPEEGSAIAASVIETLLSRRARLVVTTHLSSLKELARSREDAAVAAMEFDEKTGRPTFRLRAGLLGRSRALASAQEQGFPPETIARAREILGRAWERRERLETEAEEALARLRERERELAALREEAEEARRRAAAEAERLAEERRKLHLEGKEAIARVRGELRSKAGAAIEEIRRERLSPARAQRRLQEAEQAALAEPLLARVEREVSRQAPPLAPGDRVRVLGGREAGEVAEVSGEGAWILVRGKRLLLPVASLVADAAPAKAAPAPARPAPEEEAPEEVNVIGRTVEEAIEEVERAIDRLLAAGRESLRVVHGHGTGRLRAGLRDHFRRHPAIESWRPGNEREGGNGATVVTLR